MDEHLNLFRYYAESTEDPARLENNVTRAFICALRLSEPRVCREVLKELVPELKRYRIDWSNVRYGLQNPPALPSTFSLGVLLGISREGQVASSGLPAEVLDAAFSPTGADNSGETADLEGLKARLNPSQQALLADILARQGRPDGWVYTDDPEGVCVLIECKVSGPVYEDQVLRHERTYFGEHRAQLRQLDRQWSDVSRAVARANEAYPGVVLDEFLGYLSMFGLSATVRFDDVTLRHLPGGPNDVMDRVVAELRRALGLGDTEVVRFGHAVMFRNIEAVGNLELWWEVGQDHVKDASVKTLLSFGTAAQRENLNRIGMPEQINRLIANLARAEVSERFAAACEVLARPVYWTVLDRPVRVQHVDWGFRDAAMIRGILNALGKRAVPEQAGCFGSDVRIPHGEVERVISGLRIIHRGEVVRSSGHPYDGFRIYGRAYLGSVDTSLFGRRVEDVVAQLVDQGCKWYQILRILSGA